MVEVQDGYDDYYANRLWQLLPGVYRALDSDDPGRTGPLQELLTRIGAQAAVVRRSIDRLWADQAIETCDDWVIPYIGDLLDTNLVNGLDPRGQRLDVAKTIHYRRRKGTLAVLEEIARDVTGWDAHVVESFRRLARTRHGLDPPVGPGPLADALPTPCPGSASAEGIADPRSLLETEGLLGHLTETPAGGLADLRGSPSKGAGASPPVHWPHGALLADSPFDEYFHSADMRLGRGALGRYGIPKLLVFLWRLRSFAVAGGTPVEVKACPNQYVFDPTGRKVALFLPPTPPLQEAYADTWTEVSERQVPGPLSSSLQQTIEVPAELEAIRRASSGSPAEPATIEVWPEVGQFEVTSKLEGSLTVSYQYGFPAPIGAGPYDRTLFADPPGAVGGQTDISGGGGALGTLLETLDVAAAAQTVTLADSLTYDTVRSAGSTAAPIRSLLLRAGGERRPVVRMQAPAKSGEPPRAWVFTGGQPGPTSTEAEPQLAQLTLDGLLVSGGDIVLRGAFSAVRITGCTTDPGTLDETGAALGTAVDERQLAPVRIWIEADPAAAPGAAGAIGQLLIDHCVLGPIRTRNGGAVETVAISDSILQGIEPLVPGGGELSETDVYDPELLARALGSADPLSTELRKKLTAGALKALQSYTGGPLGGEALAKIVEGLNAIIAKGPSVDRALLEAAYPVVSSPAALALAQGTVELARVTVMGRAFVHRLWASDSLLDGLTMAEDAQDGCVRFSAVSAGSRVPRQYCSATIAADSELFTSSAYGEPGYGQLLETADRAITAAAAAVTITEGAETGSQMG